MRFQGKISPPDSEAELLANARAMSAMSLAELANARGIAVPDDQKRAKGWAGQLLESCLGATAGSRSVPDFERIGVELKTIPIGANGIPNESTYVCTTDLIDARKNEWLKSRVRSKLNRVLWIPVEAVREKKLADRRIGSPLIWSPSPSEDAVLQADWDELTQMISMGQVELITADLGETLQIRPKGANAQSRTWGVDENGHRFQTLTRGYYLRAKFTSQLLQTHFAMPNR